MSKFNEKTQKRLAELKEASPKEFFQWLELPPQKRALGY